VYNIVSGRDTIAFGIRREGIFDQALLINSQLPDCLIRLVNVLVNIKITAPLYPA
jgi:hypothetical protein